MIIKSSNPGYYDYRIYPLPNTIIVAVHTNYSSTSTTVFREIFSNSKLNDSFRFSNIIHVLYTLDFETFTNVKVLN